MALAPIVVKIFLSPFEGIKRLKRKGIKSKRKMKRRDFIEKIAATTQY
jgi:hypothetical protein